MRASMLFGCVFFALFIFHANAQTGSTDDDDFEELARKTPCWPSDVQLIMRANENCSSYATRVCDEAKLELGTCSAQKCVEETELRCPFREMTRVRANLFIRHVATAENIFEEAKADASCRKWYGEELRNVSRMGAVFDALRLLGCPANELTMRLHMDKCYKIETKNVGIFHPLARFCYSSKPIDLGLDTLVSTQCCYGSDLKLLTLGHKGAGSVDLSSKRALHSTSAEDHYIHDQLPYLACCALSDNCAKYGAIRPASILRETDEEIVKSCEDMENKYRWIPYGSYVPPYLRPSAQKSWDSLKLNASSLFPTQIFNELVLKEAQEVLNEIHSGKIPYTSATHAPATTRPTESTETRHPTTERPEATEEPLPSTAPKSTFSSSSKATTKPSTSERSKITTNSNSKGPIDDGEIDSAIEAVLKAQTKKPNNKN